MGEKQLDSPTLSEAIRRLVELGLRLRNKMAKKRSRFSLKEERQLVQMAATSATLEEAAAIFRTSVDTIENKCKKLGTQLRRRGRKRPIRRLVELGAEGEGEITIPRPEWTKAEVHQLRIGQEESKRGQYRKIAWPLHRVSEN